MAALSQHRYASPPTDRSRGWDLALGGGSGSPVSGGRRKQGGGGPLNKSFDGRGATAYQSNRKKYIDRLGGGGGD